QRTFPDWTCTAYPKRTEPPAGERNGISVPRLIVAARLKSATGAEFRRGYLNRADGGLSAAGRHPRKGMPRERSSSGRQRKKSTRSFSLLSHHHFRPEPAWSKEIARLWRRLL